LRFNKISLLCGYDWKKGYGANLGGPKKKRWLYG
jgi:hypothetical protein